MKLDLKRLLDTVDGGSQQSGEIDLSWIKRHGKVLIPDPVRVEAHLVNRASILTLSYDLWMKLPISCDRCLKQNDLDQKMSFTHTVVRSLNQAGEQDGYLVVPDGIIDIGELAAADIQLELPAIWLCKDDCMGLCPVCGADLNNKSCGCISKDIDPRLEILRKLL